MEAQRSSRRLPWLGSLTAVTIALLLVFVALLAIGNEIRYQGCLSRADSQSLIAVTKDPRGPAPPPLGCDRSPL